MSSIRQVFTVCGYNFRRWHKNPRIIITFLFAFILCFLLTDKAVKFAADMGTHMQVLEPFVWTFGDANSILLSSLLLILLFADMPFLNSGTPFYLMRINRRIWIFGQVLYVMLATLVYMLFILLSTAILCAHNAFIGDMWSETAAILGYSGAGQAVALPALVKTLEMSTPYQATGTIFLLMLSYTLLMVSIMLFFSIKKSQRAGIISVFVFSLYGFLLNAQVFMNVLNIPDELRYQANVLTGWLSPLNHATYHMHNFGYDLLPRMWQTYAFFGAAVSVLVFFSIRAMRKYSFSFSGTEKGDNR